MGARGGFPGRPALSRACGLQHRAASHPRLTRHCRRCTARVGLTQSHLARRERPDSDARCVASHRSVPVARSQRLRSSLLRRAGRPCAGGGTASCLQPSEKSVRGGQPPRAGARCRSRGCGRGLGERGGSVPRPLLTEPACGLCDTPGRALHQDVTAAPGHADWAAAAPRLVTCDLGECLGSGPHRRASEAVMVQAVSPRPPRARPGRVRGAPLSWTFRLPISGPGTPGFRAFGFRMGTPQPSGPRRQAQTEAGQPLLWAPGPGLRASVTSRLVLVMTRMSHVRAHTCTRASRAPADVHTRVSPARVLPLGVPRC